MQHDSTRTFCSFPLNRSHKSRETVPVRRKNKLSSELCTKDQQTLILCANPLFCKTALLVSSNSNILLSPLLFCTFSIFLQTATSYFLRCCSVRYHIFHQTACTFFLWMLFCMFSNFSSNTNIFFLWMLFCIL